MKCYRIRRRVVSTTGAVGLTLERDGPWVNPADVDWHYQDDCQYEIGGNTWQAQGALKQETKDQLAKWWVITGAKKSLKNSHVLGVPYTEPYVDTVVDQTFVDALTAFDARLFDFTLHDKVWDHNQQTPPWDGPFYFATIMPLLRSYDLTLTDLLPIEGVTERYHGSYGSSGGRRVVKASVQSEAPIWRDAYTREVMCSAEGKAVFDSLGIAEWYFDELQVTDDRH